MSMSPGGSSRWRAVLPFLIGPKDSDNPSPFAATVFLHLYQYGIEFAELGAGRIFLVESQDSTVAAANVRPNTTIVLDLNLEHSRAH